MSKGLVENDPALNKLYAKKLLIPGWAGEVSDVEAAYIAERLSADSKLRTRWRACFKKRFRKISPVMVMASVNAHESRLTKKGGIL